MLLVRQLDADNEELKRQALVLFQLYIHSVYNVVKMGEDLDEAGTESLEPLYAAVPYIA